MSSKLMGFQEWNEEIRRAREWTKNLPSPSTLYVSSACYSDNTKRMLDELHERIDCSREGAINWNIDIFPESIVDMIMEEQRKIVDKYTRDMLCSVPKYTITPAEMWNQFNKTNNEKEKEKMNAKKCDRCGKLYIPTDDAPIRAYLCGRVTEHEKETYLPEKNKEFNTFNIKITLNSIDTVDMCPECREKLVEFFESGAEETKE